MPLRRILARMITHGTFTVRFPDGTQEVFRGEKDGPIAGCSINSNRTIRRLILNPGLAFGEAYMDGDIEPLGCSLYDMMDSLVVNLFTGGGHPAYALMDKFRTLKRRIDQLNPAWKSRQNVAHHYDLNGRLYSLFLDRDRQYSCAYFPTGQETLEEAQALKKRHIAAKLRLDLGRPGQPLEVLDIGCGWGGMAITLARDYGAKVTGITLSTEQLGVARQRAEEAGLSDRVKFELMDYRDWKRPVDRIVSVGMFEHVGVAYYDQFFRIIRDTLKPQGVALIHAIGRNDGPGSTNDWLAKYIFPGGYSPAISEVMASVERSGMYATDIEVLRLHYALTLAHWRRRFTANRDTIQSLYDERFCRMFDFYLVICELAFRRMGNINWQIQLTREVDTLPLARDYMVEAERAKAIAEPVRPAE